jgi:hypothetical protein
VQLLHWSPGVHVELDGSHFVPGVSCMTCLCWLLQAGPCFMLRMHCRKLCFGHADRAASVVLHPQFVGAACKRVM